MRLGLVLWVYHLHHPKKKKKKKEPPKKKDPLSLLLTVLAIIAVALVVLLVLWLLTRRRRTADKEDEEEQQEAAEEAEEDEAPAEEPAAPAPGIVDPVDALAAQGRYEEAMALLLRRSLIRVGWSPSGKGDSSTAREVLATLAATDGRRVPLGQVVTQAEFVRFAGEPATRERFEAMRSGAEQLDVGEPAP